MYVYVCMHVCLYICVCVCMVILLFHKSVCEERRDPGGGRSGRDGQLSVHIDRESSRNRTGFMPLHRAHAKKSLNLALLLCYNHNENFNNFFFFNTELLFLFFYWVHSVLQIMSREHWQHLSLASSCHFLASMSWGLMIWRYSAAVLFKNRFYFLFSPSNIKKISAGSPDKRINNVTCWL